MLRKEYMGELFVGVDHWFPNGQARLWHDDLPVSSLPRANLVRAELS
jgi:hypothetical protein